MTIYYLYVKTHNITGLKYLGQTKQNPFLYSGSGKDWKNHLKKYGTDVKTEVLFQCTNIRDRNYWGRYYSKYYNIVEAMDDFGNKIWANRIPETGGGPGVCPTQSIIEKRVATRKNNIKLGVIESCSIDAIIKANQTKLKNGTLNVRTPENIEKQIKTRIARGTGPNSSKVIEKSNNTKKKNGTIGFTKNNPTLEKKLCPHCNKSVGKGLFTRWHGDNCKSKII